MKTIFNKINNLVRSEIFWYNVLCTICILGLIAAFVIVYTF